MHVVTDEAKQRAVSRGVERWVRTFRRGAGSPERARTAPRWRSEAPTHVPLSTTDIARLLAEIGRRATLGGGNPYRAKAYRRAADSLAVVTEPIDRLIAGKRLREVPGVGPGIASAIEELYRTGTHPALAAAGDGLPAGALALLDVPGLRPERAAKLAGELGITSLDALREAVDDGTIAAAKGFGPAFQAKMADALSTLKEGAGKRHIHKATALFERLRDNLRESDPSIAAMLPGGELRRGLELVGELAVIAVTAGAKAPEAHVLGDGVTVHRTPPGRLGIVQLYATGSEAHLSALAAHAAAKGFRLTRDGLYRGRKLVERADEDAIYAALGLPPIPPELREGGDEVARAAAGELPILVGEDDIAGILHAHTDRSDGVATLADMVEAVRARGYGYFGVADHSRSAHYAGGLSLEAVQEQRRDVTALDRGFRGRFRVFAGIESDILADGSLDYPDEVLAGFDFVVASIHGRFRLDRRAQTQRLLGAIAHPSTTILGHPTGRQLLKRPGYDVDMDAVLRACAAHRVAVEINANPWRLDLDWRWHRRALELGCMLSINPDAHSTDEIDLVRWGVTMARKGGVPKERVLNCLSAAGFAAWLDARRPKRAKRSRKVG